MRRTGIRRRKAFRSRCLPRRARTADRRAPHGGKRPDLLRRRGSPCRRTVQRQPPHRLPDPRRGCAPRRKRPPAGMCRRWLSDRDPRRRYGVGRKCRTQNVQHPRRGVVGDSGPDDDRRKLDKRRAGEVLPDPARRIRAAEQFDGPAPGREAALRGRLPPVPASRHASRSPLRRGRIPGQEQLPAVGLLPVALHERRLRIARHHGGGQPHGILGPEARPRNGAGRRVGARLGEPQGRGQHRGQYRRHGDPGKRRRRRGGHRRALQQRELFLDRQREDRLHTPDRSERRIRILPEIYHRTPHPLADSAAGLRHDLPRAGVGVPIPAGEPLRRPPRGDHRELLLPGGGVRP